MSGRNLIGTLLVVISLVAMATSPAGAVTAADECLLNWFEQAYPSYLSPAGGTTANVSVDGASYDYRYYPNSNAYLGIETGTRQVYYVGPLLGNELFSLGPVSTWLPFTNCGGSGGSAAEVQQLVNMAFGLTNETLDSSLLDQVSPILMALLGGGSTTCPQVATNLDLAALLNDPNGLAALPDPINASLSYGGGCSPVPGTVMSGQVNLTISQITINQNTGNLGASLSLVIDNLTENGELLGDGTLSGSLSANLLGEDLAAEGLVNLTNFVIADGRTVNGQLDFNAVSSSQIYLQLIASDNTGLSLNLPLVLQEGSFGDTYVLNSSAPGAINLYTVTFDDVTFDEMLCEYYPISGRAIFSQGGQSWDVVFDSSCSGSYLVQ